MNNSQYSILVVDDNEMNRDMLSRRLNRQGYSVSMAVNGRNALEMIKSQPFDLILLDIMMPEMNGYQVLEEIKKDELLRHIPVIMITALDAVESVVKCIEMGAEDYITKPFNPVLLKARVSSCLGKKRFHDQEEQYRKMIENQNHILDERVREQVKDISDLIQIGIALSAEKDYDKLLNLILSKSMELVNCDGGSLYILEEGKGSERNLAFKIVENLSISDMSLNEHLLPVNKSSIAGFVACTGEIINLEDVYNVTDSQEYTFNKKFDERLNYRTKSMLVVPMKDHKGNIIGILQLINRKKSRNTKLTSNEIVEAEVVPFDKKSIELVNSLASQAAKCIETGILYQNIKTLFDGFVRASAHAIEQRDPTTSGHSERVASMLVGMAELINKATVGKYKDVNFTEEQIKELRYAGLLHDFGKVGVRENVLVKEKKLYPLDLEVIKNRFAFIMKSVECKYIKKITDLKYNKDSDKYRNEINEINKELKDEMEKLDNYVNVIIKANEPSFLEEEVIDEIKQISDKVYLDYNNEEHHYLTPNELNFLCIKKGTLDEKERREIESHVTYSYEFLKKIPWTKELERIPDIAHAHHEGLSGRGYPLKLRGDKIPLVSKIMSIVDIYDALTARDRPYKKAVPNERALDIIRSEVKNNILDADLFDLFVKERVYELVNVDT